MTEAKKMEKLMGLVLMTGIIIATALVLCGGIIFLIQDGNESMHAALSRNAPIIFTLDQIKTATVTLSAINLIELGLMLLVVTQILRVGLLACFFAIIRDYKFTFFSLSIFLLLIYTTCFRT